MSSYLDPQSPFDYLSSLQTSFKEALDAAQQLFYEVIVILVSVSVLIMIAMDSIHSKGSDVRNFLGRLVTGLDFCFNFGGLGFMLFKGFLACRQLYLNYKEKKSQIKSLKIQQVHRLASSLNTSEKIKLESSGSQAKIHPQNNEPLNTGQNLLEPHFVNKTYQNASHIEPIDASRLPLDFSQTQHGNGSSLQMNDYAVQPRINSRRRVHALRLAHDKKLE